MAVRKFGTGSQQLILNGGAITLNATDAGWWTSRGDHDSGTSDYIVGYCPPALCSHNYFNDFFVFSLAGVNTTITSAALSIFNPEYVSPLPSEIYQVGSVSTPIATLEANGSGDTAVYDALASGTVWGRR